LKNCDAIIFDLDGTLWNASHASALGFCNGLSKLGINKYIEAHQIESVAGMPYRDCITSLVPELSIPIEIVEKMLNFEEEKCVRLMGGSLYPDVKSIIERLSRQKKLFLISNCQEWYLDLFFEKSGLKGFFSDYDCHGASGISKSNMIYNMSMKHKLTRPFYIGDTEGDKKACEEAQVTFIWAKYGFGKNVNSDYSINNLSELL